ncbi:MAG: dinitrogenase iron-molybdenum cofactor N-terminal domain-containing protein [Actinomycetota bacterium]
MAETPIASREAALRIALAARTLEGLDVRALVGALAEKIEPPITEKKLADITVEDLRVILAGDHADENCAVGVSPDTLKEAVRILWGESGQATDLPPVEPCAEGDMPGSIRVAVASNSGENLDGHFGSCERFLIYQVSPAAVKLVAVRSGLDADDAEDRNAARAAVIADCQILFIQSIGGPAAAKVVRAGVHPLKKPAGGLARSLLADLQSRLTTPPPWLARIMGLPAATLAKFEAMEEEA